MDVYYWPVSTANQECVSTIGSRFNDPVKELLVTDDRGYPYWKAQTNPWEQNGSQGLDSITAPPEQALPAGAVNPLSAPANIQAREPPKNNITFAGNVSSSEAIATIGDFSWYDQSFVDPSKIIDLSLVHPRRFASDSATFTRPMYAAHCQLTVS